MKSFLVIGLGRFGTSLACELCALGHEVMAVDLREERVQEVAGSVTHAAAGDARDPEVLRALGARNFDCAVVSAGDDVGTSALIVLNLKELGVPQVVGKARSAVHHPGAGEDRRRPGGLSGAGDGPAPGPEPGQRGHPQLLSSCRRSTPSWSAAVPASGGEEHPGTGRAGQTPPEHHRYPPGGRHDPISPRR